MNRDRMLRDFTSRREPWDVVVVGGGATGAGIALDAASRGYSVVLFEAFDFGKGTSSRSTKLVHGGVRYLRQGNIGLVREALQERERLLSNAPHLAWSLPFIVPVYRFWEAPMYGIGLKAYEALARSVSFGRTAWLGRNATIQRLPSIRKKGLLGGVLYHDGQFDDARLLMGLLRTAARNGAVLLNYAPVTGFRAEGSAGRIASVMARDNESGAELVAHCRSVVNAGGPFSDEVRRLADPGAPTTVAASQGAHIVVNGAVLPGGNALMVPRTADGRVLFAIPWFGHTLIGTTDTPIPRPQPEPQPMGSEIDFILETANTCLEGSISRKDVLSTWAGIRPLVLTAGARSTASLSRDHIIRVESNGLITLLGGKWTTYRHMAEDAVDRAMAVGGLPSRACRTRDLPLEGADAGRPMMTDHLSLYGSDRSAVEAFMHSDPALGAPLHPALPWTGADVLWAVREEMARTVEDVLARRTRALFLSASAAVEMAPAVARLLASELGWATERQTSEVERFRETARNYLC